MYRCEVCRAVSRPGETRTTHPLLRGDGTIERELTVCRTCRQMLKELPLAEVVRMMRPVEPVPAVVLVNRPVMIGRELK